MSIHLSEWLVDPVQIQPRLVRQVRSPNTSIYSFDHLLLPIVCKYSVIMKGGILSGRCGRLSQQLIHTTIRTTVNISIILLFSTFILNWTTLLYWFHPIVSAFKINTITCSFPNDQIMMAGWFLTSHPFTRSIWAGSHVLSLSKQKLLHTHAMRLNVCFIYYIQTVRSPEMIPIRMSGVMQISLYSDYSASSDEYPAPISSLLTVASPIENVPRAICPFTNMGTPFMQNRHLWFRVRNLHLHLSDMISPEVSLEK